VSDLFWGHAIVGPVEELLLEVIKGVFGGDRGEVVGHGLEHVDVILFVQVLYLNVVVVLVW
jgi:hypothetical protein